MMLHKKSSRSSLLKLLALLPIVGITLALNARTVTDYVYDEPQKQTPVKIGKKAGTVKMGNQDIEVVVTGSTPDDQETKPVDMPNAMDVNTSEDNVFDVVEQMPEFPGGMQKLLEFLSQNIRYPKEAMEKDIQGRVIVTFVVKKDGSISDATVVRSVDPLLDEEGLRVINAMPNWTPGMQKGEPVNVKYTVPISFKLQGKAKKEDVAQASTLNEAKE
jgi:TonB family protein